MPTDWLTLWRRWRARPALPLLALFVLVTGVGAGATVLGVTWATLLRPMPYPDPDRLVLVEAAFPGMSLSGMGLSGPEAAELPTLAATFASSGFGYVSSGLVETSDAPVRADVARVSAGWLDAQDARPAAGRLFTASDDTPSAPCRALVSRRFRDTLWGRGRDPLGDVIRLDGQSCEVIGVFPDRVDYVGRPVDLWAPLRYDVRSPSANRANHAFAVIARLPAGITLESARADLARAVDGWMEATGEFHSPSATFHPLSITSLEESIRGPVRATGLVLLLAVATMLVVTMANASGLLVADADRRRSELAIRAALGADRFRLWRMHLVEAGTLGALAGLLGGALALSGAKAVEALAPPALANFDLALPIWQTVAIAAAIAAVAAAICSLVQASRLPWRRLASMLSDDGRASTATAGRQRLRRWLVGLEVALAVALVTGAALMLETVNRLGQVDLGFRPEGVISARINLPADRYETRTPIDLFYDRVAADLGLRGDVAAVGMMTGLLPERRPNSTSIAIEGSTADSHMGTPPVEFVQFLTPGAFSAAGLSLRRGRFFDAGDREGAEPVVIVNERMAAAYFGGAEGLGRRLRFLAPDAPWLTVVGVVGDARQNGLVRAPGSEVFVPISQAGYAGWGVAYTRNLHVLARVRSADPAALGPALREVVRKADASAAVSEIETLQRVITRGISAERFLMALLGAFAALALLLATVGVYGIVAHSVAERSREIGVRRSLGAPGRAITRLVLGQVLPLVATGLVAGALIATGSARLLAPFSFETDVVSPLRLALVAGGLLLVAGVASVRPLVAALRIDPAAALKQP